MASPKTHKTGSSTLSSILFRFGVRHGLRMFHRGDWTFLPRGTIAASLKDARLSRAYSLEFHHLSPNGRWKGNYQDASRFYRHIIGPDVRTVAIFREPRQQYVSWAYFYHVPNQPGRPALEVFSAFARAGRNPNPLAGEFGLYTQSAVDAFIKRRLQPAAADTAFTLVMLAELFDESLLLLRRKLNWDLRDITYLRLLDSHSAAGRTRWDGKPLQPTPKLDTLPPELVDRVGNLTRLDQQLYEAARARLTAQIAVAGPGFAEELAHFRRAQAALRKACAQQPTCRACAWYTLSDLDFFRIISPQGHSPRIEGDLGGNSSAPG